MRKEKEYTLDEVVMAAICKAYSYMDEEDAKNWSVDEARNMVHDLRLYDKQNGSQELPYDVLDFYDTIKQFIQQDYSEIKCN
ncbi:MAG: hypothetical protein Q4E42_06115 [Phascolarctobacterium sp.]|nr:hypothetical protein [Phascolarctobacterium sp.]